MKVFLTVSFLWILSSCSYPLLIDLKHLNQELNSSRNLLDKLYDNGFESAVKDIKRHVMIAKGKSYDALHETHYNNEFETLKLINKKMMNFNMTKEVQARIKFDLIQIENLSHDIKKKTILKSLARKEVENEKNAIIPYLSNLNNSINHMLSLMKKHDSIDNHMQLMWDKW